MEPTPLLQSHEAQMLSITSGPPVFNCRGVSRRSAIKAGVLGLTGLTLPNLLAMKASAKSTTQEKSVILIWLDGGPSQLETYDPKPDAPAEYRGPQGIVKTKLPGVNLCDWMPETAKIIDKVSLIRSIHHDNGDHFAAGHWMTTGKFGSSATKLPQVYPSVGSYIAKTKGPIAPGMPAYVGLPAAQTIYLYPGYMGAAYLGGQYNPFQVNREEAYLGSEDARRVRTPKWLKSLAGGSSFTGKRSLVQQLDGLRRDIDQTGTLAEMDVFQRQAMDLVLGSQAREAFDFDKEDPKALDRYGKGPWAHYTAMARRLVEAGVRFVTVDMPHWDDHSDIKKGHGRKVPVVDRAVAALVNDLDERGLFETTIVLVMGEFGRTPKINTGQPGIPIPGRDHWGNAISAMIAGGGIKPGVVVGKTNAKAEHPVERALKPADLLATVYHQLGIDHTAMFKDHTGRPIPILDEGEPIRELV
jgi:uncharacterized protein (DUF1501 family)